MGNSPSKRVTKEPVPEEPVPQQMKLLLLGIGSSGKTSIFKSMKILHSHITTNAEILHGKTIIRDNMIVGICNLIQQCNMLFALDNDRYKDCLLQFDDYENKNEMQDAYNLIQEYSAISYLGNKMYDLAELRDAILMFWSLECVRNTYAEHGKHFRPPDNLDYFLDRTDYIMDPDDSYIPTQDDLLRQRCKTTGTEEYTYKDSMHYEDADVTFQVIDVGGVRAERRQWIDHFQNVSGILYVASLMSYNQILYEDNTQNAMAETLQLFSEITAVEALEQSEMILILTKDDLLRQKLLETPENGLSECFSEEAGWPHWTKENDDTIDNSEYWDTSLETNYINASLEDADVSEVERDTIFERLHDDAVDFIHNLFVRRNQKKLQGLHTHITVGVDTEQIETMMNEIQKMLIEKSFSELDMMYEVGQTKCIPFSCC